MNYTYQAYGLNLDSSVPLRALAKPNPQLEGFPRVSIVEGRIEKRVTIATNEKPVVFEASSGLFYCQVLGAGSYEVTSGRILMDRDENSDDELFHVFLHGVVLASCAYFNKRLLLHASAIEFDDTVLAFCGDSGSGKSTTAAVFEDAGYPMISDDVLSIGNSDNGSPTCYLGPAISKLDETSTELANRKKDGSPYLIDKYHFYDRNWSKKSIHPLSTIFSIETDDNLKTLTIQPQRGIEKIQTILRYLYRNYWIGPFGMADQVNQKVIDIAPKLQVFNIRRPTNRIVEADEIRVRILDKFEKKVMT